METITTALELPSKPPLIYHEQPKENQKVVYINASALKSESNCDLRFFRKVLLGYTKENKQQNYKAGYGTAFHKGLEVWYNTEPELRTEALAQTILRDKIWPTFQPYEPYIENDAKGWRNANHLGQSWIKYTEQYPGFNDPLRALTVNNNLDINHLKTTNLLEQKFCIPYYESPEMIIYITGTIDMPGEYCGELCLVDHKTTSMKPGDFFELFKLSVQAQFYVYWFRVLTGMKEYVPFLINGIFVSKNLVENEKKNIFSGVTFQRKSFPYDDSKMKVYSNWLKYKLNLIINYLQAYIKYGDIPFYNPAACEGKWSVCQYYCVCSQSVQFQDITLQTVFRQETYNPLQHIEDEI